MSTSQILWAILIVALAALAFFVFGAILIIRAL